MEIDGVYVIVRPSTFRHIYHRKMWNMVDGARASLWLKRFMTPEVMEYTRRKLSTPPETERSE